MALLLGAGAAFCPSAARRIEAWRLARALARVDVVASGVVLAGDGRVRDSDSDGAVAALELARAGHAEEIGPWLSSWQTVGGCGAGSATGAGAGVKWIGRGVRGGLFNITEQATYTRINTNGKIEHHSVFSTLLTRDIGEKWLVGVSVPFVYKYLNDPYDLDIDISNGGVGDISVQATRRFGAINDTIVTAALGIPTGTYDAQYRLQYLRGYQQLGFGKVTGSLLVDHIFDQVWGVAVVGGLASWRGGQNRLDNYRSPSGTGYGYVGYFLGPFVPAVGLALTGFPAHDRDLTQPERTGLFSAAGSASVEWSNDYVAVLLSAVLPYQYDGFYKDANGNPRSPWGFGSWMVGLGVAVSPF